MLFRSFEFLREQSFSADLREGNRADAVARGAESEQLHLDAAAFQFRLDPAGLVERQRRTSGSQDESGSRQESFR